MTDANLSPLEQVIARWKKRRFMLNAEYEPLQTSYPTGDPTVDGLTQQDKGRLRDWIAVLDRLIAEYSR
jgi:hypothetical protein